MKRSVPETVAQQDRRIREGYETKDALDATMREEFNRIKTLVVQLKDNYDGIERPRKLISEWVGLENHLLYLVGKCRGETIVFEDGEIGYAFPKVWIKFYDEEIEFVRRNQTTKTEINKRYKKGFEPYPDHIKPETN